MHGATETHVESTTNPVHGEELAPGFLPNPQTVQLDIVLNDQFHVQGGPLVHGYTEVVLNGNHGFRAALVVPRPVDLRRHPNGNHTVGVHG